MHICLQCYRGNPYCGGQGVYLINLSKALSDMGHRVTLLVGPPYPGIVPWARVERVTNGNYWGKRRGFLPREAPTRILRPSEFFEFAASRLGYFPEPLAFSLRAWRAFARLHSREAFDVIHDVETLGYGLLLARQHGAVVVSTVHHPLSLDREAYLARAGSWKERYYNVVFFPLIMQGMVARRVDAIITSSVAGKEEIQRVFGVDSARVHLVHTGVDLETFCPDPKVERDYRELLFVGNAQDPRKGIKVLLEALVLLPPSVHLTIVDEDEPHKTYAPALVRQMGLGGRVKFTGRLSQTKLVERYRRAWVLVLPSRFEGFGLPVVEALGCETPVVVTRAGSLPEVVGEGEGGLLVPPEDPRALAEAVHAMITRQDMARQMGEKGRRRVKDMFSWERTAARTVEVYRWAMRRTGGKRTQKVSRPERAAISGEKS